MTRRLIVAGLVLSFVAPLAAVGSRKAQYMGGTLAGLPERKEGRLDTTDPDHLVFTPDDKKLTPVLIPYAQVTELEYGQKAGRRIVMGVLLTPLALFAKKRSHYLTISFTDADGKDQAAVFELGKGLIRTALTVVETRTGKEVQYQDEEARKAGRGGD